MIGYIIALLILILTARRRVYRFVNGQMYEVDGVYIYIPLWRWKVGKQYLCWLAGVDKFDGATFYRGLLQFYSGPGGFAVEISPHTLFTFMIGLLRRWPHLVIARSGDPRDLVVKGFPTSETGGNSGA